MTNVGIIGLGFIGSRIARDVLAAGFQLHVYDIDPQRTKEAEALGASPTTSVAELASLSDVIEVVVFDDAQAMEVMDPASAGIASAAKSGAVIAVHSTVLPSTIERLAVMCEDAALSLIDAPLSGGSSTPPGGLCYMVGAAEEDLERCRSVLSASANRIYHMGPLGSGVVAKIVNNLMCYVNTIGAAEGLRIAKAAGADIRKLAEVVNGGSGQSGAGDRMFAAAWRPKADPDRPQDYPSNSSEVLYKDLAVTLALAHSLGVRVPVAALTQQLAAELYN
jgi:3-hydroxyisobutyrate dehydrogenase-like beta-hydroxyacid dehydrogenase